jgi:hypothetical protein
MATPSRPAFSPQGMKRKNNHTANGAFKKVKTTKTADDGEDKGNANTLESCLEPYPSTDRAKEAIEDGKRKATEEMGAVFKGTKSNPVDNKDTEDTANTSMHHPDNKQAITTPTAGKNGSIKANHINAVKRKPTTDISAASKKVKMNSNDFSLSDPNFWNS